MFECQHFLCSSCTVSVMNCVTAGRSVTSVVPRFSKSAHVLCVSALTSPQELTVGVLCLWQVRQLVKDGFLVEVSEGTRKLRHVFLFTDLLLCAKMKKTAVGYEHGHSHTNSLSFSFYGLPTQALYRPLCVWCQ